MRNYLLTTCLVMLPPIACADVINFDFTGRFSLGNTVILPISASLIYDTEAGLGNSDLSLSVEGFLFGSTPVFHDITMSRIEGSNLLDGYALVDWNGIKNMSHHLEWDASGMFNAIAFGLEVGDTISGTNLIRNGIVVKDVESVTPFSDSFQNANNLQGYAPIAATSNSRGLGDETPFPGVVAHIDIGSGNSLHVTGYSVSAVPVPAAVWLFGSGLLGLIGVARRKKV